MAMQIKTCRKCKSEKPISSFYSKKDGKFGVCGRCKECISRDSKEYYGSNKEKISQRNKKYVKCFLEKLDTDAAFRKEYYKKKAKRSKERKLNDPEYRERRTKIYRGVKIRKLKNNIEYKIKETLRSRTLAIIKNKCTKKAFKSMELLGNSINNVREHIEHQFSDGMSWKNHGVSGWHIDHIIPCNAYDLTKPEEQKKCFNYRNLRPAWEKENTTKKDFLDYELVEQCGIFDLLPERLGKKHKTD